MPCDSERDFLGGAESQAAIGYLDERTNSLGVLEGIEEAASIYIISGPSFGATPAILMELDGQGENKGIRHSFEVQASPGCPFCHSPNWRGDFP
jgi:hypothetical protein